MFLSVSGFIGAIANKYIPVLNSLSAPGGLKVLALAHTTIEGFYEGSKAYRTNNPGNIGTSAVAGTTGAFKTLQEGTSAQLQYLQRILDGKHKAYPKGGDTTLQKYIFTYAPPVENNSNNYVNSVIATFRKQGITITPNTTLKQIAAIGDEKKKSNGGLAGGFNSVLDGLHHFIFGS